MSNPLAPTPAAARTGYHHGDLRRALIEQGLSLLEQEGQTDFSLRSLARAVGVSANAAYRHFADKDDLLQALAAEGFRLFTQALQSAIDAQTEPLSRLRASGKAYVAFAIARPELFRLMFSKPPGAGSAELQAASLQSLQVLMAASAAVESPDEGHAAAVQVRAAGSWALVHGLAHLALSGQLDVFGSDLSALVDGVVDQPWPVAPPSSTAAAG